jgi:hypothetical protein
MCYPLPVMSKLNYAPPKRAARRGSTGEPAPAGNPPLPARLRPKAAAALVPCSIGTLYNWMEQNRFKHWMLTPPGKNRGLRFIDTADFMRFLAEMEQEAR